MIFKSLIEVLAQSIIHISSEETNTTVVEKFRVGDFKIDPESLTRALTIIRDRDNFTISIEYTDSDQTDSLSRRDSGSVNSFCDRLDLQVQGDPDLKGVITVHITKGFTGHACSVYSLSLIEKYWRSGGIASAATKLWALAERAFIIESSEIHRTHVTGLFVLRSSALENTNTTNPEIANKEKLLSARNKGCLFYESKKYPFLPQDFDISPSLEHSGIADLFNTLKLAFSLVFLADVTSLDGDTLTATIKGYRHVTGSIQLDGSKDAKIANDYYEIYRWAYADGSVNDKLGIARNLLSIHIEGDALRNLQEGSMAAILSNYSIYLKDNVKQYIEVKNKLSDQIHKQSEKASDMVKSIGGYLRASVFSVYSFVLTTIIIRSISKGSTGALFSDSIYLIFIMFILLSLGTLVYAYQEAEAELNRFKSIYKDFKSRFDDLLSNSDRDRILQNDKEFKRDVEYVIQSRKRAVLLWISCLVIAFIFVTAIKITQPEVAPPAPMESMPTTGSHMR